MEHPSQREADSVAGVSTLKGQLREMYGRAAYTHKTHEKMADRYMTRYKFFKTLEIVLSAVASSSFLIALLGDSHAGTIVGAIFSTSLLFLTLYFKEAALTEKSQVHTEVASKLWAIREALLSLLVDMNDKGDVDRIRTERDRVNASLEAIYESAPRTDGKAYRDAQSALKDAEELFFSDEELDKMLPKQLRGGHG